MADSFFQDAKVLGFVTSVKGYRFCLSFNQQFSIDLRRSVHCDINFTKKGRKYTYYIYKYKIPGSQISFTLYTNYSDGECLVPELKNFDYVLIIFNGEYLTKEVYANWLNSMRKLRCIQMVSELDINKIPSRENLIM